MATSLLLTNKSGDEIKISLHPISLALVVIEVLEDVTRKACSTRGHVEDDAGHCERCGTSLPESGTPYGSWLPTTIRSFREGLR